MAEKYVNSYTGEDLSAAEQFRNLAEALSDDEIVIPQHFAEPTRPRIGRIVVADGTRWDPLSVGVPRIVWYNGTAWVALDA